MKLSIITINLNDRIGLEKTIKSVINQSFNDFEYLVIDGASTDGSTEVITKYQKGIHYAISEPDSGTYNAMNKGIRQAKGDYLLFLNSGDFLLNEHTLSQIACYLIDFDIIYGNLRYFQNHQFKDASYPDELSFSYLYENYLPHPASFIKRELFTKFGAYEEQYRICADWVFFLKSICLFRASYLHINQVISVYNTEGISAQKESEAIIKKEREQVLSTDFRFFKGDYLKKCELEKMIQNLRKKKMLNILQFFGLYTPPSP